MVKKVTILMVILQTTSMSQAMMTTGMRRMPAMVNPTMRGVGAVAPSMVGGLVGDGQNYNYTGQRSAPVQAPQYSPRDLLDADASPIVAEKIEQNQAGQAMPVIDVEKIMESDAQSPEQTIQPANDENGGAVADRAPEFDVQEFKSKVAVFGPAHAIYANSMGGMQKRSFSTNARSSFVPFNPKSNSPYDVLGVSQGATAEQITAAYKKLVQQYHPDRNQENKEQATKAMQMINDAYDQIKDGGQGNVQSNDARWDNVWQWSSPDPKQPKYEYNDYRVYAARGRSYGISDDGAYYNERSRQNNRQWQAFISDPNSAYNKPRTLKDAFAYNYKMRNLKTIENLLKHATQEEINDALHSQLRSHNLTYGNNKDMTDSDFEILKLLINASSDMNYQNSTEDPSLLIMACNISHQYIDQVISLMIKKNINPNAIDPKNGLHLLLKLMVGQVSLDIIEKVIAKGADVNYVIMPPAYIDGTTYTGYIDKKILDVAQEMLQFKHTQDRIHYYNSVIALLKKHGATETSMWEKMKRRF